MRRPTPLLLAACILLGFLFVTAARSVPADPAARLPQRYELADLIVDQQRTTARLRTEVAELRAEVERHRRLSAETSGAVAAREEVIDSAAVVAGLVPVTGPGLKITLDDSDLEEAASGNINDLVVHSQDVQAVVNALWRAGAEAIGINGQRLVGTSAVLCVGNTLLLNGTVHSPPYVISAAGARRDRFEADRLVRRLHRDADEFGLRFSVERADELEVPAYRGTTKLQYAQPVGPA